MKKLCLIFALFCAMFFFAACGEAEKSIYDYPDSSNQTGKNDSDTSEKTEDNSVADDADSSGDDADKVISDSDEDADTTDSEPTDDADSQSDGDADTAAEENDDDTDPGIVEPSEAEKCVAAGGSWTLNGTESGCIKITECDPITVENAEWNGAYYYARTYTDGEWSEEIHSEYSEEAGACKFKCKPNYEYENNSCVAKKQTATCEIPANASPNSATEIEQTWSGTAWLPSEKATYNLESSNTECRFVCENNYDWNGSECVANPCVTASCASDANSDGTCYTNGSNYICGCNEHYFWSGSACVNPCDADPCGGIPHSTCIATSAENYSCECDNGYSWNETEGICQLPACDENTASFPCQDSTGYIWSERYDGMEWQAAIDHCTGLNTSNYGGYSSGWHLPNISELRTLIKNCADSQTGGSCGVTASCLSDSCWNGATCSCSEDLTGGHSKFGETGWFWSSSTNSDNSDSAWLVVFNFGFVIQNYKTNSGNVRCVRPPESDVPEHLECADAGGNWNEAESTCTKTAECSGLPENAQWNGDSSYTMTYTDGDWSDEIEAEYNKETAGTCHYKCADGYLWNNSECANPCPAGYFWTGSTCASPCDPDPCNHGVCTATDATTYSCACEENYFWTGSTCVDPCEPNPCSIPNSTGVCTATDATTYSCACEENYFWTDSTCVSPCDPNPCNYTGSTGVCTATDATTYTCDCEEYYFWTGSECIDPCPSEYFWSGTECVNPCDPNPCDYTGSTGFCTATGTTTYTCGCENNYFWSGSECVNPCNLNPCDSVAGINNVTCVPYTYEQYSCDGKDPSSGLTWSVKAQNTMSWNDAVSYCNNLTESGSSDWRLPTISELRTLIQNCSAIQTGGSCGVTDSCLSYSDCRNDACDGCSSDSTGKYSKFGDTNWFWSSSVQLDNSDAAWPVNFNNGYVSNFDKTFNFHVRCVR